MKEGAPGQLLVVTGIPSAGKTTVSREVARRSSFRYFDGDLFVKALPPTPIDLLASNLPAYTQEILDRMLSAIEDRLQSENVVLDMILPASYVERIRDRFGGRALFVSLTVDPTEQQRREAGGGGADPYRKWAASRTDIGGPDSLYDAVIDTSGTSPGRCAEQILSKAGEGLVK